MPDSSVTFCISDSLSSLSYLHSYYKSVGITVL